MARSAEGSAESQGSYKIDVKSNGIEILNFQVAVTPFAEEGDVVEEYVLTEIPPSGAASTIKEGRFGLGVLHRFVVYNNGNERVPYELSINDYAITQLGRDTFLKETDQPVFQEFYFFSLVPEAGCPQGNDRFRLFLRLDKWPEETTWRLIQVAGGIALMNESVTLKPGTTKYSREFQDSERRPTLYVERCIPQNETFQLTVFDSNFDGIASPGGYAFAVDETLLIVRQGWFTQPFYVFVVEQGFAALVNTPSPSNPQTPPPSPQPNSFPDAPKPIAGSESPVSFPDLPPGQTLPPVLNPTLSPSLRPTSFPTSVAPTGSVTTLVPSQQPVTLEPTTLEPTTLEPTTLEPTTLEPTTLEPTTLEPTTLQPTTVEPSTMDPTRPTTLEPTTLEPTTLEPTTLQPTIFEPTTTTPTSVAPTSAATTFAPSTLGPSALGPTSMAPTSAVTSVAPSHQPTSLAPTTLEPSTLALISVAPAVTSEVPSQRVSTQPSQPSPTNATPVSNGTPMPTPVNPPSCSIRHLGGTGTMGMAFLSWLLWW